MDRRCTGPLPPDGTLNLGCMSYESIASLEHFARVPGKCMLGKEFEAAPTSFFSLCDDQDLPCTISIAEALEGEIDANHNNQTIRRFNGHNIHKKIKVYSHMFVFYNVFTMYESHDDAKAGITTGRRMGLDEYFSQIGATIVGVAEARTCARRCSTENYLILAGGSEKQQFGCEVWVSKLYPIQGKDGKKSTI